MKSKEVVVRTLTKVIGLVISCILAILAWYLLTKIPVTDYIKVVTVTFIGFVGNDITDLIFYKFIKNKAK